MDRDLRAAPFLWRQQQLQQSRRPLLSVGTSLLAHGSYVIGDAYVWDQPFAVDSRPQSRWRISVVPLLCVLDLSPIGRSPLEVRQRRFVPSGRAPLHFILSFVHVAPSSHQKCVCHFYLTSVST